MKRFQISDTLQWQAFYLVCEKQSFSEAAKALGLNLPSLSKRISILENKLGRQLFHRTTRKINLTEDARELLPLVKNALDEMNQLEAHIRNDEEISGVIRMTSLAGFAHRHLTKALIKFQKKYPEIRFDIHLSDQIIDMIENGIDIAIRVQEPQGAEFIYRKLIPNRLILCASPKYLAALKQTLRAPKDLFEVPLLFLSAYRKCRFIGTDLFLRDFEKNRKIVAESGQFLTELALQGSGIAVRSTWDVKDYLEQGKLKQILPNYPLEDLGSIYAVTPPGKKISRRIRIFLDFLIEEARGWDH